MNQKLDVIRTCKHPEFCCLSCVLSWLEGTSQTRAAQVEEHRRSDDQNNGADEEDARVRTNIPKRNILQNSQRCRCSTSNTCYSVSSSSLCFQFLLPVIQISLICLCVGGDPMGIQVAVVNNETSPSAYSNSLLSFLDNSSIQQVWYNKLKELSIVTHTVEIKWAKRNQDLWRWRLECHVWSDAALVTLILVVCRLSERQFSLSERKWLASLSPAILYLTREHFHFLGTVWKFRCETLKQNLSTFQHWQFFCKLKHITLVECII